MSHNTTATQSVEGVRSEAAVLVRPVAVATVVGAVALTALAIFGDGSSGDTNRGEDLREFAVISGVIVASAAAIFGWVVPRRIQRGAGGGAAIALSIAAAFLVPVAFWSGLPPVLAAGGMVLGYAGWTAGRSPRLSLAAIVVGALALIADVAIYALDWASTNNVI